MRHASPHSRSQVSASRVPISPTAWSRPLGLHGFLSLSTVSVDTSILNGSPGVLDVPSQCPLPAHLI